MEASRMRKPYLPYSPETMEMPEPVGVPRVEPCKRIPTHDASGAPNGQVIELAKHEQDLQPNQVEGDKSVETTVYLTTVTPHQMKGYHGHTFRTSTYVAVGGQSEIHMLNPVTGELLVYEFDADQAPYRTITVPGYFLALKSRNGSLATFIGVPNPPFHPLVQEQVELAPAAVEQAIKDGLIKERRFRCTQDGIIAVSSS
jgi:hypothetical protein